MTRLFFLCLCLLVPFAVFAQFIGFEEQIPETFTTSRGSKLELSSLYYKEGTQCLQWNYLPGATLDVSTEPLLLDTKKEASHGITLWIYNEKSQNDSIRIAFLNKAGEVSYWFAYQLKATGWRACWISFEYMKVTILQQKLP